jgi:hypothetical protein
LLKIPWKFPKNGGFSLGKAAKMSKFPGGTHRISTKTQALQESQEELTGFLEAFAAIVHLNFAGKKGDSW